MHSRVVDRQMLSCALRLVLTLAAIAAWYVLLKGSAAKGSAALWRQHAGEIVAVALLVPLNVAFETAKLQALSACRGRFAEHFMHTCRGMALQSILPLGAGTYAGRVLGALPSKRRDLLAATFGGGVLQNLCNALGFILVILVYHGACFPWMPTPGLLTSLLMTGGVVVAGALCVYGLGRKIRPFVSKILNDWLEAFRWPALAIAAAAGWSLLRYLVYFAQLAMMVDVFSSAEAGCTFFAVSFYCLLVSAVVLPSGMALAVRGGIAPFVFGPLGLDAGLAASVAMLIFLLNNLIPAILGVYFLLPTTPEAVT
ncbi:MAG: hypothetical protein JPMHGGIA_01634 [Saprospiraceae bacterium]|jgi:hypothetical protein|nr:hypothetical protein [Saprospiraceae bacterium]